MIDAKEIKAAVEMLDAKDATHWDADGSPSLAILKVLLNNDALTSDDVDEAVGAYRRPGGASVGSNKKVAAPKDGVATSPPVLPEPINPLDPEYARKVVAAARAEQVLLRAAITDAERREGAVQDEIRVLKEKMDEQIVLIDRYGPRVSQADSVKAIQRQTAERLAISKEAAAKVQSAVNTSGQVPFASALDRTLAMRKRTPEQQAAYAKYVHQNAAHQVASRG